jgi:N-acetylmuramic acid 6-phosphate etherase
MGRPRSIWESLPTEALHPKSVNLDRLSPGALLELLSNEDRRVVTAVGAEAPRIARAAVALSRALSEGGRVFLAGAGTSGRLGVLEAAECPPTFGTDPDRIVGLIAGGEEAVHRAVEGAEDRESEGRRLLRARRLRPEDLVVGISASSVTPFVRGALDYARERGASTVLVTCAPGVQGLRRLADVVVAPRVGAEVLAGSTRMKAGTATKLVLNRMTLLAMVRLKKVYGSFMVELRPGSAKLRDRARRMIAALAAVDSERASELLERAGDVKTAVAMGRLGISYAEARRRLSLKEGDLRAVLSSGDARSRSRSRRAPARPRARTPKPRARLS